MALACCQRAVLIGLLASIGCGQTAPQTAAGQAGAAEPAPCAESATNEELRRQVATAPADVDVERAVQYATVGEVPLFVDLYVPRNHQAAMPLLVWIHGGGWSEGSKHWCPLAWLAGHGYVVASIQYRLSGQAPFPAQIHDCKGAIRWLRAHAEDYGIDAARVGVAGASAGGQLAALLATSSGVEALEGDVGGNLDQSSDVQAVIDMCGTSDFLKVIEDYPEYAARPDTNVAALFAGPPAEKRELARIASAVEHVDKNDPPLLIFHGAKDPIVPLKQSERLRDAYREAGLEVDLSVIADGEHVPREFWDATRRKQVRAFYDRYLRANR